MQICAPNRKELDRLGQGSEELASGSEKIVAGSKAGEIFIPSAASVAMLRRKRWGVVLAGGDGMRLKTLTRAICGDERPKQFCALVNGQTLLAQTLRRAELTFPPEQLLVSLTEHHRDWYLQESGLGASQRIIQPSNRATAPPIAHSLLSIGRIDENAAVAILPSDHHYADEHLFAAELEAAFVSAEEHPHAVVLLGARPDYAETEYGWIELGASLRQQGRLFHVRAFREKPTLEVARRLLRQGSVWNTFVMVGRVSAFLEMLQAAVPEMIALLRTARLWDGVETHLEHSLYQELPATDFSRCVLSVETERLLVSRLGEVGWNDLGDPERALSAVAAAASGSMGAVPWRQANTPVKPPQRVERDPVNSGAISPISRMASEGSLL